MLQSLALLTKPGAHLIGSVPNRFRRFRKEQKGQPIVDSSNAPRFIYRRDVEGVAQAFEYSAYSVGELRNELAQQGWKVNRVRAETTMTETIVTSSRLLGRVDSWAASVVPATTGYCILYEATVNVGTESRRLSLVNERETIGQ